ncbi:hypothetical protein Tco_0992258 [Tanacetum coccineum]|uniref:Reverse transcriptase zinc-binding domain-containing protein n=1 Tax=Tanacetum coccineum TaxID=301880 RepID=A0ABQ5F2D4_9ASTR
MQHDSHDHLFFECAFSSRVWNQVLNTANINFASSKWSDIVDWLLPIPNRNNVTSIVGRLIVDATSSSVAVSSSLRLLEPKRTIESRAKRSSINLVRTQHPSETMVFHNEDGNPARANIKQALGVKASANSDVMYFFTSAQDGDPLQDDVRLCLGDDLKKAQDHTVVEFERGGREVREGVERPVGGGWGEGEEGSGVGGGGVDEAEVGGWGAGR